MSIIKLVFVVDPTTNAGPEIPLGLTDRRPHGEDDAIPSAPVLVKVEVAVWPKYARPAESCVVEALPLN